MRVLEIDVPEYFVTHIGRAERVGAGCMRLVMCVQRGEILEPRYSCIWPVENLLSRSDLVAMLGKNILGESAAH